MWWRGKNILGYQLDNLRSLFWTGFESYSDRSPYGSKTSKKLQMKTGICSLETRNQTGHGRLGAAGHQTKLWEAWCLKNTGGWLCNYSSPLHVHWPYLILPCGPFLPPNTPHVGICRQYSPTITYSLQPTKSDEAHEKKKTGLSDPTLGGPTQSRRQ